MAKVNVYERNLIVGAKFEIQILNLNSKEPSWWTKMVTIMVLMNHQRVLGMQNLVSHLMELRKQTSLEWIQVPSQVCRDAKCCQKSWIKGFPVRYGRKTGSKASPVRYGRIFSLLRDLGARAELEGRATSWIWYNGASRSASPSSSSGSRSSSPNAAAASGHPADPLAPPLGPAAYEIT